MPVRDTVSLAKRGMGGRSVSDGASEWLGRRFPFNRKRNAHMQVRADRWRICSLRRVQLCDANSYREIARHCRKLLKERSGTAGAEVVAQLQQWAVECDRAADRLASDASADGLREQARRHRLKAAEYRAVADQVGTSTARASYRALAETYEAMARQMEARGDRLGRGEKETG